MKNLQMQAGQALLIILLIMAVALTVGLGVVSRSITDIKISRQEEESARVFSVAEAGIEEALRAGAIPPGGGVTIGGITATVSKTDLGGGTTFVFPKTVEAGDTQTVWLVEHDGESLDPTKPYLGTQVEIYWGNEDVVSPLPAVEATVIYDLNGFKIARYAIDPDEGRATGNKFDSGGITTGSLEGKNFKFKKTITLPSGGTKYALRLKLLYNDQPQILGVKGDADFPSQGECYESTASLLTSGITRKVQQCQSYKSPPGIFDYVLLSGGDLVK